MQYISNLTERARISSFHQSLFHQGGWKQIPQTYILQTMLCLSWIARLKSSQSYYSGRLRNWHFIFIHRRCTTRAERTKPSCRQLVHYTLTKHFLELCSQIIALKKEDHFPLRLRNQNMVGEKLYGFTDTQMKDVRQEWVYKFSQNKAKDTSTFSHSSNIQQLLPMIICVSFTNKWKLGCNTGGFFLMLRMVWCKLIIFYKKEVMKKKEKKVFISN